MKNHKLNLSFLFIALILFVISGCKFSSDQARSSNDDEAVEEVLEEVTDVTDGEADPLEDSEAADAEAIVEDYSLIYTLPDFTFSIPDGAETGYTKDLTDQRIDGEYLAELFLMYETDAFGADFRIYSDKSGFRVIKIEQQASSNLFFNEDGSGGTWTIDGVDAVVSDWMELEHQEDGITFHSLSFEELESSMPDFSVASYENADNNIAEAQISTTYMAQPSVNKFRITYETDLQVGETVIAFNLLHGD